MIEEKNIEEATVDQANANTSVTVKLSDERKRAIEVVANEYFDKLMQSNSHYEENTKKNDSLIINFLNLMNMLESSSATSVTDFISVFFSKLGTSLHDMTSSTYKFYTESPIIQLFIGEDNNSCIEIFRYFKKYITDKATSAINTHAYIEYEDFYVLLQIYYLNPEPMEVFLPANRSKDSTSVAGIVELYEIHKDSDFAHLLHFISGKISTPPFKKKEKTTKVEAKENEETTIVVAEKNEAKSQ